MPSEYKQYEQRDLSGVLFRNDGKLDDKQPDYKGSCKIGEREYWVSGWVATSKKNGSKYMQLKFKEKDRIRPAAQSTDDYADSNATPTTDDGAPF